MEGPPGVFVHRPPAVWIGLRGFLIPSAETPRRPRARRGDVTDVSESDADRLLCVRRLNDGLRLSLRSAVPFDDAAEVGSEPLVGCGELPFVHHDAVPFLRGHL